MTTRRTRKGWVMECTTTRDDMCIQGGVCGKRVLYRDATIRRAGYAPSDDPMGILLGEYVPRAEMLCNNYAPDMVLRRGKLIR